MDILAIIPARAGSKGVPGKNSKKLCGRPLVDYTFVAATASSLLTKIVLSSDDDDCIAFAKAYPIETPFKRPAKLATDKASSLSVVQHSIIHYRKMGIHFDAICLLQPTTPFRKPRSIDKAIERFKTGGFDSLVSVLEVPHEYNPHWVFEDDGDGSLKIATGDDSLINRRQELPAAYHRDGSIYLVQTEIVMGQDSLYGKRMGFIKSDPAWYVNIDNLEDWEYAERLASMYKFD